MVSPQIIKFCRLKLGMKPVIDYVQSRRKLLGVADLPIRTVFDVGANIGKKSRLYQKMFPQAKIYCFEPVQSTFRRLESWASQQHGQVQAFNLALGSKCGKVHINSNLDNSGGSTVLEPRAINLQRYRSETVAMETLDSMAARLNVEDDVFVKIDVEGFDMEVVRGGQDLLSRAAAVIIEIAITESPTDLPTFPQFMAAMSDLGYLYRGNLAHGYVEGVPKLADAVFIRPPAARRAAA